MEARVKQKKSESENGKIRVQKRQMRMWSCDGCKGLLWDLKLEHLGARKDK